MPPAIASDVVCKLPLPMLQVPVALTVVPAGRYGKRAGTEIELVVQGAAG